MTQPDKNSSPTSSAPVFSGKVLALLGAMTVVVTGVVISMVMRGERKDETVIAFVEQPAATNRVNVSEVIDARNRREATAALGTRYRVVIDGESRDSAAGVAHIGGLITFVPDTHKGDEVIIEVTRLKSTTAEAVVVERLARSQEPAASAISPAAPAGPVYTGVVESVGRKGDGIIKMDGKVVFVPGVQQGDRVVFAIAEDREKHAVGQLVSILPGKAEVTASASPAAGEAPAKPAQDKRSDIAQPGEEFEVKVVDSARDRPTDGVAKIQGLVVFVPGTKPGDHVKIRIVKRGPRSATAEVIEHLPADPAS